MRTLILSLILSVPAAAQSFNMDVGSNLIIFPAPASTYGAGANQPGFWNAVNPTGNYANTLSDLAGNLTTVTTLSTQSQWYNYFPSTLPDPSDDRYFMIDIQPLSLTSGPVQWTFSNLANGDYAIYTYAWAPENTTAQTRVTVTGAPIPIQFVGGPWGGSPHVANVTYCVHNVTVTNGTINLSAEGVTSGGSINGFQFVFTPNGTPSTPFCLGDGSGAACPCGNTGSAGNGCANSSFAAGGHLVSAGNAGASAGTDTLTLTASNIPGPGLFFQSNGVVGSPLAFGDGQLCAAIGIIRMGVVFPTGSSATYPGGLTPNPIHIAGGPLAAGDLRHYQVWYRDAVSFCTIDTFNLTNGVSLTWGP